MRTVEKTYWKNTSPEHVDWQLWNSIVLMCYHQIDNHVTPMAICKPCNIPTKANLDFGAGRVDHSLRRVKDQLDWVSLWRISFCAGGTLTGFSDSVEVFNLGMCDASISHPWVTITGWAHLMIYFRVTDLRHCSYKPSKKLLYIVKSNPKVEATSPKHPKTTIIKIKPTTSATSPGSKSKP